MIGKLFGKPKDAHRPPAAGAQGKLADAALRAARDKAQKQASQDPLAGAKIAGEEVFHRLMASMKNAHGVHVESLLCVLGALAGYACQAEVRAIAQAKALPDTAVFQIVAAADGRRYYFGDLLNQPLLNAQPSLWGMAGASALQAGATALPDPHELFRHVAASVGNAGFGIPRVPAKHKAGDTPLGYLKQLWPALFPLVQSICPQPALWPVVFGVAIQRTIDASKDVIDGGMAFTIAMEAAVPMSKVELGAA
jgi:hypothetical protein